MYGYKLTEKGRLMVAALVGTAIQVLIMALAESNAVTACMLISWGLSLLIWYSTWPSSDEEPLFFYQYVLIFVFSPIAVLVIGWIGTIKKFLGELVEPVEKAKRKNDEIN